MDSEVELIIQELEYSKKERNTKIRVVFISSYDDYIKIHTDLSIRKDSKTEDLLNSDEMDSDGQNQSNIEDVNKTTKNLTIADIKRLAASSLNTDFDESQVNSIIIKDSNY